MLKFKWYRIVQVIFFAGFYLQNATAQTQTTVVKSKTVSAANNKPKLVVGIVVDQMRYDYLYRYKNKFGKGGFNRLLNDGFNVHACHYNYIPTETAPGHASIYTGTTPSMHGIVANEWIDKKTKQSHSSVSDTSYVTVGNGNEGRCSPSRLKTTTVTDELKLFSNFRSRVFSVALKDRSAILPAGHTGNGAFWFDDSTGNFISSSYYFKDKKLPAWATKFNNDALAKKYLEEGWKLSQSHDHYTESTPDNSPRYETPLSTKAGITFNYDFTDEKTANLLRFTSWGNTITKEFAMAICEGEKLGKGSETDFLCVSFSSTDIIGHQFGINAVELEECYKLLDTDLANFFNYLDVTYGFNNVLVFLTADHGAVHNPVYLNDRHLPGEIMDNNSTLNFRKGLQNFIKDTSATEKIILEMRGHQLYFNDAVLHKRNYNKDSLSNVVCDYLNNVQQIYMALPAKKLWYENYSDGIRKKMQNGFNFKESGDVMFCMSPATIQWRTQTGTTHGSPYDYDTHVPLLFAGWKIKKGETFEPVNITDIAPTISAVLKISNPSGCSGKTISDVFK